MRIMAIDFGDARIGIAISDAMNFLVGDAFTINEREMTRGASKVVQLVKERDVGKIVLGYPKNMDGTLGVRAEKSEKFKAMIEGLCDVPVILWDERRTSISAHQILHQNGKKMKDHRKSVDAVAASLILEGFLGTL